MSASLRLEGSAWGDVHGADAALVLMIVPTADPDLRAGTRLDFGVGVNFEVAGEHPDGFQRVHTSFVPFGCDQMLTPS